MNDDVLQQLLDHVTKTLDKLKEEQTLGDVLQTAGTATTASDTLLGGQQNRVMNAPSSKGIRVFLPYEKQRMTKASFQFLNRILRYKVLPAEIFEQIIHRLVQSDSQYVCLDETKWIIQHVLAEQFEHKSLAFWDLILYQKEDGHIAH